MRLIILIAVFVLLGKFISTSVQCVFSENLEKISFVDQNDDEENDSEEEESEREFNEFVLHSINGKEHPVDFELKQKRLYFNSDSVYGTVYRNVPYSPPES